jgi:predicted DNA-binding mobile mystery protein A
MRLIDLAARLNVTEGAVRRVERAELSGSLTLKQLDRAALAMGCRFVYAIVPETTLEEIHQARLRARAADDARRTARTMDLEQQSVAAEVTARHTDELFDDYLRVPPGDLWRD